MFWFKMLQKIEITDESRNKHERPLQKRYFRAKVREFDWLFVSMLNITPLLKSSTLLRKLQNFHCSQLYNDGSCQFCWPKMISRGGVQQLRAPPRKRCKGSWATERIATRGEEERKCDTKGARLHGGYYRSIRDLVRVRVCVCSAYISSLSE